MRYELTIEQRDEIMGRLTEEQRHFIHHELVRGRRTLFARQLARKKCQFIPEEAEFEDIEAFIEEWDYIGFTDSGEVSPLTKCECGRSLRYQHKVMHIPTNTMRYFGIEHLQLHTGIDAKAITAIMKGFDVLDGEMNEILHKYRAGWQLGQHIFLPLPEELDVPRDIQAHIDAGLPLLDRQLLRLRGRLRELQQASRQRRIAAAMSMNGEMLGSGKTLFEDAADDANDVIGRHTDGQALIESRQTEQDQDALFGDSGDRQETFVFGESDNSQGAFVFGETGDSQGAFVFGESGDSQGALVFGEPGDSQGAFVFGELPSSGNAQNGKAHTAAEAAGEPAPLSYLGDPDTTAMYVPKSFSPFHLPSSSRKVIDDALKYSRISTMAVSEFLIERKLVQDVRMSTGKPDIYIAVAAYLDKLTSEGKCSLVSASAEDRVYAPANR